MKIEGNRILDMRPINFWTPSRSPVSIDARNIEWVSTTAGGAAGFILTLADVVGGSLEIETVQGKVTCSIRDIKWTPKQWTFGGLDKTLSIYRLPGRLETLDFSFDLPLDTLQPGVNPVFVRVVQEDGHVSWSSPIYIE